MDDNVNNLIEKLSKFVDMSNDQKKLILSLEGSCSDVQSGECIERSLGANEYLYLVKSGWISCSRVFSSSREVLPKIYLPGDIIGLESASVVGSDFSIKAITSAEICHFKRSELANIFKEEPKLATLFFFMTGRDQLIALEILTMIVGLRATPRLAGFILLLKIRLEATNSLIKENSFEMMLTQAQIGDVISLSQQQINRSFKELEDENLIERSGRQITIKNISTLESICEFSNLMFSLDVDSLLRSSNS